MEATQNIITFFTNREDAKKDLIKVNMKVWSDQKPVSLSEKMPVNILVFKQGGIECHLIRIYLNNPNNAMKNALTKALKMGNAAHTSPHQTIEVWIPHAVFFFNTVLAAFHEGKITAQSSIEFFKKVPARMHKACSFRKDGKCIFYADPNTRIKAILSELNKSLKARCHNSFAIIGRGLSKPIINKNQNRDLFQKESNKDATIGNDLVAALINNTSVEARGLLIAIVQLRGLLVPKDDIMYVTGQNLANALSLKYDSNRQRYDANKIIEGLFNELSINVKCKLDTGGSVWQQLLVAESVKKTYKSESQYKIEFRRPAWTKNFIKLPTKPIFNIFGNNYRGKTSTALKETVEYICYMLGEKRAVVNKGSNLQAFSFPVSSLKITEVSGWKNTPRRKSLIDEINNALKIENITMNIVGNTAHIWPILEARPR